MDSHHPEPCTHFSIAKNHVPCLIRTFRNTDVSAICAVWNAHYGLDDSAGRIDALRLEIFGLAKPYFDDRNLLIAEQDGEVVGFLHCGPTANETQTDLHPSSIGISSFCVKPQDDDDSVAAALLEHLLNSAAEQQKTECFFKPILPNCAFYLGVGPADSMAGATTCDARARKWISEHGFVPNTPTCQWELDLSSFQAPVDRTQIQIRRAAQVNRQVDEPTLPWWQACVLGHTEQTAFQLTHRTEKRVLGEILYWSIAPELLPIPDSLMWLWPPREGDDPQAAAELQFLLSESLRQFQSERVATVRTVLLADENSNTAILRKLGFAPAENGVVFRRELAS